MDHNEKYGSVADCKVAKSRRQTEGCCAKMDPCEDVERSSGKSQNPRGYQRHELEGPQASGPEAPGNDAAELWSQKFELRSKFVQTSNR